MSANPWFARAQDFIWRNARLLDRQLFACLFSGGSREPVLAALRAYQNADGGFGNALEPDMRCPVSQPVSTDLALQVLDLVDAYDDPMVGRACGFLASIATPAGALPTALPSVIDYPAAPWWVDLAKETESLNPTAGAVGMLLKHGVMHPWVKRATEFCWQAIENADTTDYHRVMPAITFLEHVPDRRRAERQLRVISVRLLGSDAIAYDTGAEGYVQKPLDWAPTPESFGRRLFSDEVIATHLQALAARQQPDGGWPITWQALSPGCEMEWRGWITVQAVRTLRAYGAW